MNIYICRNIYQVMYKFIWMQCSFFFISLFLFFFLQLSYSMELDYDVVGVQGLNAEAVALLRPRVNVSAKGEVPVTLQIFRIRIPCSGLVSAEIPMALRLNVSAPPGTRYNDTTLILRRNKICLKGNCIIKINNLLNFHSKEFVIKLCIYFIFNIIFYSWFKWNE